MNHINMFFFTLFFFIGKATSHLVNQLKYILIVTLKNNEPV